MVAISPAEPEGPDDPSEPGAGSSHGSPAGPPLPGPVTAGFTHRDPGQQGTGFAAGGDADTMDPGPALAALTADAWTTGLASLDDDELAGLLCAWRRISSWAAAGEAAAVAELAR
ncbi:MAG TPA: hypothetical protein VGF32_15590, partial [Streptosporangiaceae bacterium]